MIFFLSRILIISCVLCKKEKKMRTVYLDNSFDWSLPRYVSFSYKLAKRVMLKHSVKFYKHRYITKHMSQPTLQLFRLVEHIFLKAFFDNFKLKTVLLLNLTLVHGNSFMIFGGYENDSSIGLQSRVKKI